MHQMIDEIRPQIAPDGTYTIAVIAALTGVSRSHVTAMHQAGYLPPPARAGRKGGGWRMTWTGRELLAFADTFDPSALEPPDHDVYAPSTCRRLGCRCGRCTAWHNASTRDGRRARRPEFGEGQRAALLAAVEDGSALAEAAELVGLSAGAVKGRARTEPEFAARLAEACWSLCANPSACGTPGEYRRGCRGTGCTTWRREYGRVERAAAGA